MDTGIIILDDYGWGYIVFLVLITAGLLLNVFSSVRVLKKGGADLRDYADVFLKYTTIVFMFLIGAWCIFNAITPDYDAVTVGIHAVLGALLIADGIFTLVIKLRYKSKGK